VIAYAALLISILSIAGVLFALGVGIIVNKAIRETRGARDARRRAVLEPRLLAMINAEEDAGTGPTDRRKLFAGAFGAPPPGRDWRVIEAVLIDHAVRLKGVARERISQAFDELGYVDVAMAGLTAGRWWRRADAAEKLGLARAERAIDPLVARMDDPEPEVRLRAAKALGEIRGRAAVAPLVAALTQPNRWSTLRVADILSRMGVEAAESLCESWASLPPPGKLATLDILGKLGRPEAVGFIRKVLRDGDPDERARAAHALGAIGHHGPIEDLRDSLRDGEWSVRAMAAKALGRIGSPQAVDSLAAALKDREWWVRSNAAQALKVIGPRGQQALLETLDETDTYARQMAVLMLEESGVLADCVAALDSKEEAARSKAEGLIRQLVALGRTDFLEDMSREFPNPRVRAKIGQLLEGRA
jgi:HEAT repeat protein